MPVWRWSDVEIIGKSVEPVPSLFDSIGDNERTLRSRANRITADLILAIDDATRTVDDGTDNARVDRISMRRSRAGRSQYARSVGPGRDIPRMRRYNDNIVAESDPSSRIDILHESAIAGIETGDRDVADQRRLRRLQHPAIAAPPDTDTRRAPVVHDIADDSRGRAAFQSRIALIVVGVKATFNDDIANAIVDERAHRMTPLRMRRVGETLGDQAIAHRDVMRGHIGILRAVDIRRPRCGEILVDGPGCRAVIEEHVMHRPRTTAMGTESVWGSFGTIAWAYCGVLHDNIVSFDRQSAAYDRDPGIRCRLPRDREMRVRDDQRLTAQIDHAADFEDHQSRPVVFQGAAQGAGAAGVKSGHTKNDAIDATIQR